MDCYIAIRGSEPVHSGARALVRQENYSPNWKMCHVINDRSGNRPRFGSSRITSDHLYRTFLANRERRRSKTHLAAEMQLWHHPAEQHWRKDPIGPPVPDAWSLYERPPNVPVTWGREWRKGESNRRKWVGVEEWWECLDFPKSDNKGGWKKIERKAVNAE